MLIEEVHMCAPRTDIMKQEDITHTERASERQVNRAGGKREMTLWLILWLSFSMTVSWQKSWHSKFILTQII